MANTQVAKKTEEGAVALPEGFDIESLTADAQALNPVITPQDVAIPYIQILQALSPQVNKAKTQYIEGAEQGMFYNTVTGEVWDGDAGFEFVPCHYERKYVEWVDRDNGGGWVAEHDINSGVLEETTLGEKGKRTLPNGNVIVETAYHFGLAFDPIGQKYIECVLAMKSTGLKVSRKLNHAIATSLIPGTEVQAPRFLFPYAVTTAMESKNENTWFTFKFVKGDGCVSSDLYEKARRFAKLISTGVLSRAPEPDAVVDGDSGGQSGGAAGGMADDEIPF